MFTVATTLYSTLEKAPVGPFPTNAFLVIEMNEFIIDYDDNVISI